MKRPAAAPRVMKRPASGMIVAAVLKRPSSNAAKKTAEKITKVAKTKKAETVRKRTINRKQAAKERPQGCSKCRWQRGCTPSCWKGRHVTLVG